VATITGWLRLVSSLKLQVSFAEYHLFYRALFAKKTYDFKEPTSHSHPIVGSLKVKVSNAKEPYKRDDILQKRPMILRSLLIVATP